MNTAAPPTAWSLEVVRGRDVGRRYALAAGELAVGNAPGGLDLADQEVGSARRMAPRQALLVVGPEGPSLADLDSPGGTFVNRQRLLGGQARRLAEGDVIQAAGVQLKLVRGATPAPTMPPPPPPAEKPSGFAFALRSGAVCRTWDDFLAVSAQRWDDLREELTAGRLAGYLRSIGRADRAPSPTAPGTPDERLDAWLASLPTSKAAAPEIEVHPPSVSVRVAPGASTVVKLRLANAGYRLLRATARVEPATATWLRLAPAHRGAPILAVESAEVAVEVDGPGAEGGQQAAALVFDSNGGTARVEVCVVSPSADEPALGPSPAPAGPGLVSRLSGVATGRRILIVAIALMSMRVILFVMGRLLDPTSTAASLRAAATLLAAVGAALGLATALRRGTLADAPFGAVAGAIAGVLAGAVVVAACRSVEPSASAFVVAPLWGLIGAMAAWASSRLVPYRGVKP